MCIWVYSKIIGSINSRLTRLNKFHESTYIGIRRTFLRTALVTACTFY